MYCGSSTASCPDPPHLVEEALARKPKRITLNARNPENDLKLDGSHMFLCTDGSGTHTIDFETGERRPSTKE
ncbi:MAG: trimethylamine methyltransferase family protein, partial [Candidatus Bathyarchaeota archaeon]